jgi:hypothetical protein
MLAGIAYFITHRSTVDGWGLLKPRKNHDAHAAACNKEPSGLAIVHCSGCCRGSLCSYSVNAFLLGHDEASVSTFDLIDDLLLGAARGNTHLVLMHFFLTMATPAGICLAAFDDLFREDAFATTIILF